MLFFEQILAIEGCRIVYKDEEEEEDDDGKDAKILSKKFEDDSSLESSPEHGALLEEDMTQEDSEPASRSTKHF